MTTKNGVFCLEGDWERDIQSRQSVEPILRLLSDCRELRYVHRDVATESELRHYLNRWLSREKDMAKYRIGYLAFHGDQGLLELSPKVKVTLDELATILGPRCGGRIIYLGSCRTLAVEGEELRDFCARTGAAGIVGYTKNVWFTDSVAFDVIMLIDLVHAKQLKAAYKRLCGQHPVLTRTLGLRMATATWASDRTIALDAATGPTKLAEVLE